MQDDTYRITMEALTLFRQLPECEQHRIIDYLKARAFVQPTSVAHQGPNGGITP